MPASELRLKCVAYFRLVVQMPEDRPNGVSLATCERLVVVLDPDDAGHRPENLLAVDAHLGRRLGEERRLQVEARRRAVQPLAAPGELGALLLADLDVALVLVELALVDDRADLRALLQRVVDDQRP